MRILLRIGLAVVLTAFVVGCAGNMTAKKRTEERLPANSRIAVLPFENLSGTDNAAEKITEDFQSALLQHDRFETIPYGTVYDALRRMRIRSSSLLTDAQIDSLRSALNANFIVTGSVMEFDEFDNTYLGRVPQVSFTTRVINCATKEISWVATSNGRGDKGEVVFGIGAVRSADDLAMQMVEEAVTNIVSLFEKR